MIDTPDDAPRTEASHQGEELLGMPIRPDIIYLRLPLRFSPRRARP